MLLWTVYCVRRALCSFHLFRNNVSSRSPLPSYRIMPKTLQHKSISVAKPGAERKLWQGENCECTPGPSLEPRLCLVFRIPRSRFGALWILHLHLHWRLLLVPWTDTVHVVMLIIHDIFGLPLPCLPYKALLSVDCFLVNVQNMIASFFQRLLAVFLWYLLCIIIPSHCLPCSPRHL